jgi:hypothetical protein
MTDDRFSRGFTEETSMKKSLLATVAAAALIAGPGLAIAQKQEAPASKSEAPARAPAAVQNAPAEKVAPAGKVAPDRAADTKTPAAKPSTTGQASPSGKTPAAAETKSGDKPGMKADTKSDMNADTKSGAKASGTADTKADAKSSGNAVALTTEQKTKIRTTVLTKNAPRVSNINFSLNVGAVVPRSVRIVAVPPTLVEIHPAWRGYMYFVYNDRIVIVEPGTLKIVTIIEV